MVRDEIIQKKLDKEAQTGGEQNYRMGSRDQKEHKTRTTVTQNNLIVGDYVMVRGTSGRNHNLESKWYDLANFHQTVDSITSTNRLKVPVALLNPNGIRMNRKKQ